MSKVILADGIPRRIRLDLMSPAELVITEAIHAVEELPPDTRLTEAQVLLDKARELVADFVDENIEKNDLKYKESK